MYLIVSDEYVNALLAEATRQPSGILRGNSIDAGAVLRLMRDDDPQAVVVGRWQHAPFVAVGDDPEGALVGVIAPDTRLTFLRREGAAYVTQHDERFSLVADYHARTVGLFDSRVLQTKTVTIIGLGTGGSVCATELAKAGVGNFRLVDFDRLAVHNIARHVCGVRDLGRLKTDALRDHLANTNPAAHIETYPFDITTDADQLAAIIGGSDLVIGATDSEGSKSVMNRMAWELGVAAVYGAAYEMGFGGDVLKVVPPDDACYECFRTQTADMYEEAAPEIEDYAHIAPQPALGLDVSFPALIMARVALTYLLTDDPSAHLEGYPTNWVLWNTQPRDGWVVDQPLQARFVDILPDPVCPVCHRAAYMRQQLGMDSGAIAAEAHDILDGLPSLPPTHA